MDSEGLPALQPPPAWSGVAVVAAAVLVDLVLREQHPNGNCEPKDLLIERVVLFGVEQVVRLVTSEPELPADAVSILLAKGSHRSLVGRSRRQLCCIDMR